MQDTNKGLNDCINPGESLAEMYQARERYKRNIKINEANPTPDNRVSLAHFRRELAALNAKIATVENAGRTGGIIRIM